jgi:hypothetical protein
MACYFLSQENHYQEEEEIHLETQDLLSRNTGPWNILETIPVRLSIYIFFAHLLGPIISGISE